MKLRTIIGASALAMAVAGTAHAQSNNSTVNQNGNGHEATVTQEGEDSISLVDQSNADNTALVDQQSATDTANSNIEQTGTNERASVIQVSGAAESDIVQSGGPQNASVYQDGSSISFISMPIRPSTPADHEAIWAILEPVFSAGESYAIDPDISREDALDYWLGSDRESFVFEQDGAVLGTYYLRTNAGGGGSHV